ncbi:sensor histidine kinase, putative [Ricinus communis]|uniref:Sensor histidine kinase, putative n=1 Tax=Ricinus communis TaxID=3988 RepID=B9RDJ9_RICCO|nr:sensor histidine kinase, putative [Ricinus communis]
MRNEQVLSVDINAEGAAGVSILVVDCDSACLAIVSKMLYISGYKVITAKRATDALHILRERQYELDLILTEVHLPDMDKYELLETMAEVSCLPIVILSADDDENAMLGCLFKGAVFYLLKPITMNDVKSLWQFSCVKNRKNNVATEGSHSYHGHSTPEIASNEASECLSVLDTSQQNAQKSEGKELQEMDKDEEATVTSTFPKKPKLIWTNELHDRFLQAIRILGIDSAHPKKILKHMNVPGLRKENISSHLQKYRLSLKREQEAIQKTMYRDDHYPPWNLETGTCEFLKAQFLMTRSQPEFRSYAESQRNLHGCLTPVPSLGSANYHVQLSSECDQINSNHSSCSQAGIRINNNEELESFDQIRMNNVENFGLEIASDGGIDILGNSSQQQEQYLLPPLSPLPLVWEQQEEDDDIFGADRAPRNDVSAGQKELVAS